MNLTANNDAWAEHELSVSDWKLIEGAVMPIVSDPPVHNAPEPLNRVQMGSVWGQKVQSHSAI